MSKSFSSDNFRKGKLYGKLMTGGILLFFVLLLGVVNASAIECPPGFKWVRMSGVGCVQENCMEIENAKLSYTSSCICIDGYKGCYESVDYTNFDKSKCFPNCPGARLVACVKPGEPCPDQKTPPKIEDCMAYCRKYHGPHGLGTIKNGKCDCKCEKGYEPDKTLGCIPTKEQCNKDCIEYHGTDKIHGPEAYGKVVDGICNCYCKDGYKPDNTLTCVKVKCPPNSINVAELGSACPKDRKKLNDYCCCDTGYVPWDGVCIKEEDVPGKVVCGKWGCQEGEDCLNCPQDCGCIAPEICDPFSKYANPVTGCSPKVAYIFISSDISKNEFWWIAYKINHIREYYRSRGYEIYNIYAGDQDELVECLSNPSTKAIAYFGHAGGYKSKWDYYLGLETVTPTIEYLTSADLQNAINGHLLKRYYARMNRDEAKNRANDRSTNPNLDYAYVHACFSLDDRSLADYLVRSGGTYWGEDCGRAWAIGWLDEYIKP